MAGDRLWSRKVEDVEIYYDRSSEKFVEEGGVAIAKESNFCICH